MHQNHDTHLTETRVILYQNVTILDVIGTKDNGIVATIGALRCAKLQSNRHHQ